MAARTGFVRALGTLMAVAAVAASAEAAVGPGLPDQGAGNAGTLQAPGQGIRAAPAGGPNRALLVGALAAGMAADTLLGLAGDGGKVPRQSDPRVATALDAVLNVPGSAVRGGVGRIDVPPLLIWLASVEQLAALYGTGGSGPVLYAVEAGRVSDAQLTLSAALADAVAGAIAEISASDAGRSGLDQMRTGIVHDVRDVISDVARPGVDAAWRTARVRALLAAAPDVAMLLLPDQCTGIRSAADAARQSLNDAAVGLGLADFANGLAC